MSFCPESPIWLEWKGHTEAAWRARGQLQGQVPPVLPQVTNLGATHFGDVEKQETTTFNEEEDGPSAPLRGSDDGMLSSEAGSSHLVRPPWPVFTAVQPLTYSINACMLARLRFAVALSCLPDTVTVYTSEVTGHHYCMSSCACCSTYNTSLLQLSCCSCLRMVIPAICKFEVQCAASCL